MYICLMFYIDLFTSYILLPFISLSFHLIFLHYFIPFSSFNDPFSFILLPFLSCCVVYCNLFNICYFCIILPFLYFPLYPVSSFSLLFPHPSHYLFPSCLHLFLLLFTVTFNLYLCFSFPSYTFPIYSFLYPHFIPFCFFIFLFITSILYILFLVIS